MRIASSAVNSLLSNVTRSVPFSTNSPSSNNISFTILEDLEVMSIDSFALAVPKAVKVSLKSDIFTVDVITSVGVKLLPP